MSMSMKQKTTQYSPGPWMRGCGACFDIFSAKFNARQHHVATVHNSENARPDFRKAGVDRHEAAANARLIAAAPELLEALQELLAAEKFAASQGVTLDDHMKRSERFKIIESAIAKATSQEPTQ